MEEQLYYKPLIEGMVWSYSRVKAFSDCPYRWYLKYIYLPKLRKKEQFFASYGSFMHYLLAEFYSNKKSVSEIRREYLLNFQSQVLGYAPSRKIFQNYFSDGKEYLNSLTPTKNKVLLVEEKFQGTICGLPFVGYIDLLEETADGELILIDHKSRALKPRSKRKKATKADEELDDYLKQLYVYSAVIHQKYGKFPEHLAFNCFRKQEFIIEPFNEDRYYEVMDWFVEEVQKIKDVLSFPPDLEFFKCRHLCEMLDHCEYFELERGGNSYQG